MGKHQIIYPVSNCSRSVTVMFSFMDFDRHHVPIARDHQHLDMLFYCNYSRSFVNRSLIPTRGFRNLGECVFRLASHFILVSF